MMMKPNHRNIQFKWGLFTTAMFLLCSLNGYSVGKEKPYKGYTGTVYQFGFIGGMYLTANPNYSIEGQTKTFHDYGLGAVYTLHDYVTKQFTFDLISSITLITAKSLEKKEMNDHKQKMAWPIDCRFYLGPSEDFQAYIGTGLQWNILEKTTDDYDLVSGSAPNKTIHQLSCNTAIGLNILGPQNHMFHLNVGAKFHYAITDNDHTNIDNNILDMTTDRSCVILNGGITIDIDKKKKACLMLNYEHPLGNPVSNYEDEKNSFFKRTQTITMGVVFHVGGTRK